ncbi:MAG TPA: class I lanthipeptide [Thermoanaerobaculia bacterium]|nr:class I lanthipeptide [Thermoanaerobaculia bacterium]
MKKSLKKLTLHRETLAALCHTELDQIQAGAPTKLCETGNTCGTCGLPCSNACTIPCSRAC